MNRSVLQFGLCRVAQRVLRSIAPVLLVAALAAAATACPTCKDGLGEHDPHYQSLAAGFNYSILFMLSMPYVILSTFGYCAYVSIKRAKARRLAGEVA